MLNPCESADGSAVPYFTKDTLEVVVEALRLHIDWSTMQITGPDTILSKPSHIQTRVIEAEELYFPEHCRFTWVGHLDNGESNRCNEQAALDAIQEALDHLPREARATVDRCLAGDQDTDALHNFIMGTGELEW